MRIKDIMSNPNYLFVSAEIDLFTHNRWGKVINNPSQSLWSVDQNKILANLSIVARQDRAKFLEDSAEFISSGVLREIWFNGANGPLTSLAPSARDWRRSIHQQMAGSGGHFGSRSRWAHTSVLAGNKWIFSQDARDLCGIWSVAQALQFEKSSIMFPTFVLVWYLTTEIRQERFRISLSSWVQQLLEAHETFHTKGTGSVLARFRLALHSQLWLRDFKDGSSSAPAHFMANLRRRFL